MGNCSDPACACKESRELTDVCYIPHGGYIELSVLFAKGHDFLVHGGITSIGDDAFHVFQFVVLVPHTTTARERVKSGLHQSD